MLGFVLQHRGQLRKWNELKQVSAKNLRGEEPEPEPDWEGDEPVYDGLQARGRAMEKVMDEEVASDQRQALKRGVGEARWDY